MPQVTARGSAGRKPGHAPDSGSTKSTTGKGWGGVQAKKKAMEEQKELSKKPAYLDVRTKFYLKGDGDSADIQFIDDEPYCVDGCTLKVDHFNFYTSRKTIGRSCPMVDNGNKLVWRGAFKILDFRGNWDKDKGRYAHDEPVVRYLLANHSLAVALKGFSESKGVPLSKMVITITRHGEDKTTTYNLERAINNNTGNAKKCVPYDEDDDDTPSVEEALAPLPAERLERIMAGRDDDSYSSKRSGSTKRSSKCDDDDEDDKPFREDD